MKVLYVTKNLPYGSDEAFIYPEIRNHLEAGLDIAIVPVQKRSVVHEDGQRLQGRTWGRGLIDASILAEFALEFLARPVLVTATLAATIELKKPRLWPRNIAVWAKGVWLARAARRWQADHIHVHWIAVPATMAYIAARISGIPFSITAHRYDIAQGNIIPQKSLYAQFIRSIDLAGAAEIEAQQKPGQPAPIMLHMGVSFPETAIGLRNGPLDQMRAVIAARLVAKKGHETLFRSIALAREHRITVELAVYGDGPLEPYLRKLANTLGIEDIVTFGGVMAHEALMRELASGRFDLAILPSVTAQDGDKEGIPVFLMEAMGIGLPAIATPNGGIAELILDQGGLMVPEYDFAALAKAIEQLARDGSYRQDLAATGRAQVIKEFDLNTNCERLRSLMSAVPAMEKRTST